MPLNRNNCFQNLLYSHFLLSLVVAVLALMPDLAHCVRLVELLIGDLLVKILRSNSSVAVHLPWGSVVRVPCFSDDQPFFPSSYR